MSTPPNSGSDWAQAAFPLAGPFDTDHLIAACDAIAELVRYVAHATYPVRDGLRYAPDAYAVLGRLSHAVHSLHQVCEQIGHRLDGMATDPTLRVDQMGRPAEPAALARWAADLLTSAGTSCWQMATCLDAAQSATGRLYHHLPPDDAAGGEQP